MVRNQLFSMSENVRNSNMADTKCPRCSKLGRQIKGGPPRCFNMACPVGYYYADGSHLHK